MKRVLISLGVVAVVVAIVAASLGKRGQGKGVEIDVEPVARRSVAQIVKASGEIDPRVKVNISAHVIGKIERLFVEEGDPIAAGQPFLELEKEAFVAFRDEWQAQLRMRQTDVRQAEVRLDDARLKLERARRLLAEGISSQEQLEAAEIAERSAELSLESASESVSQARANLDKAQDDLNKTTIYAPLTGRVIALNAEEGEVVVSGTMNNPASVIGTIADLSEILAVVDVDETEIVRVATGQKAQVEVDALPERTYEGKVVEIASSGFTRSGQDVTYFKVKILLSSPDEDLKPGMSLRADILSLVHEDVLTVPIQAVVQRKPLAGKDEGVEATEAEATQAEAMEVEAAEVETSLFGTDEGSDEVSVVFVVADGTAHQRRVLAGISDALRVEIRDGLEEGEEVVKGPFRALRDLKDGDEVREKEATKKEAKKDDGSTAEEEEDAAADGSQAEGD